MPVEEKAVRAADLKYRLTFAGTLWRRPFTRLHIAFGRGGGFLAHGCADGPDFCHGGDIVPWANLTPREINDIFKRYMTVFNRLERFPIPVIAAVQGLCNGGGWELALRADILFASENARFSHSEQTVAFVTVVGGVYRVAERAGRLLAYHITLLKLLLLLVDAHELLVRLEPLRELLDGALEEFDGARDLLGLLAVGRLHLAHPQQRDEALVGVTR